MKKSITAMLMVCLLILAAFLPGCSRAASSMNGSGKIVDQDIEIAGFTRITTQAGLILELTQAESFKVTLSTDDNLVSRIVFSLEDENLKIAIQAPANFFPTSLKVKISMPRIYGLNISGETQAVISGFRSTFNFDLEVSKGSTLNGALEAGNCVFNVSGNSRVNLKGSALSLELNASGTSQLNLAEFTVNAAQISLKEKSEAYLNINGITDVKLEEGSRLYYLGDPRFSNTSISGGSFMQQK